MGRQERLRAMGFRILVVAIFGAIAYSLQGLDGDQAILMAALPAVAAMSFILLGPG